jgi:membrane associated rhomboid family serine protease
MVQVTAPAVTAAQAAPHDALRLNTHMAQAGVLPQESGNVFTGICIIHAHTWRRHPQSIKLVIISFLHLSDFHDRPSYIALLYFGCNIDAIAGTETG